jgi:hypothetical protein
MDHSNACLAIQTVLPVKFNHLFAQSVSMVSQLIIIDAYVQAQDSHWMVFTVMPARPAVPNALTPILVKLVKLDILVQQEDAYYNVQTKHLMEEINVFNVQNSVGLAAVPIIAKLVKHLICFTLEHVEPLALKEHMLINNSFVQLVIQIARLAPEIPTIAQIVNKD